MSDEDLRMLEKSAPNSLCLAREKYRRGVALSQLEQLKILEYISDKEVRELYWVMFDNNSYIVEAGSAAKIVAKEAEKRQLNLLRLMDVAEFNWNFGQLFWLETVHGNYVWSDPDYQGDNSIHPFYGSLRDWSGGNIVRCKGKHIIRNYCFSQGTGPPIAFNDGQRSGWTY